MRYKKTSLLIFDFVTKRELCIGKMEETSFDKDDTFSGLLSTSSPLRPPPHLASSFSLVHSRLRRPREWPRIMTLLRGHSQLTAIKTLVIATDELYNYHVAPRCIVLRYNLTISHSVLSDLILDFTGCQLESHSIKQNSACDNNKGISHYSPYLR